MDTLKSIADEVTTKFPRAAWMNIAAGLSCGFVIGVPPMLIHFQSLLSDCRRAQTLEDCGSVSPHICHWETGTTGGGGGGGGGGCIGDILICEPKWNQHRCLEAPLCSFNAARNQCEQSRGWGWSNGEVGFFASAAVFGAVVGTLIASAAAKHEQPKRLNQFAMFVSVGSIVAWGAWIFSSHGYLVSAIGFLVGGIGFGGNMALAPTVVAQVVSPSVRALCGTLMQLSITVGIAVSALLALMFGGVPAFAPHVLFLAVAASGGGSYYVADAICKPIVVDYFLQSASFSSVVVGAQAAGEGESGGGGGAGGGAGGGGGGGVGGVGGVAGSASDNVIIRSSAADVEEVASVMMNQRREVPPMAVESGPPGLALGNGPHRQDSDAMSSASDLDRSSSNSNGGGDNDMIMMSGTAGPGPTIGVRSNKTSSLIQTCYVCGFLLASSLQVTGVNAIMGYSAQITSAAGINSPLLGNFVIMLWNAVACIPAIPLAARYPPATLYLGGLAGASASCFLTALAMLIHSTSLAFLFVLTFILCFEIGMGPMYYSLMTEVFPPEFRSVAVGRINLANFGWNIVVAFSYPALCEALIPSGADLSGGVRRVFVLFGLLGIVCLGALYVLFPKTYLKTKTETPPQTSLTESEES